VSSTDYANINTWRNITGFDNQSGFGNPNFVLATGTSSTVDLHVQGTTPAEGSGISLASVTDDFDGQTRSGLTPVDIGADAGSFTASDIFAPVITYTALTGTVYATTNTQISATITDATG